ncbi:MAG: hypothetical protein ACTSRZ_10940 [Promethearchaeota archaeon]
MRIKTLIKLFTLFTLVSISFSTIVFAIDTKTLNETNELAATINKAIMDNYMQGKMKSTEGALLAHGFADDDKFIYPNTNGTVGNAFAIENVYALEALEKVFLVQGDTRASLWASEHIFNKLFTMFGPYQSVYGILEYDGNDVQDTKDTFTQFLTMYLMSAYYADTKDSEAYNPVKTIYNNAPSYAANTTPGYYGKEGGYWTRIQGLYKDVSYIACNANTSLMAAAGLARFAQIIPEKDDPDGTKKSNSIIEAERALAFVEEYCSKKGFYTEYDGDTSNIIHLKTQAYALHAFAQVYKATGKRFYILKADALLRKIAETLWDTGRGGAIELYNVNSESFVDEHSDGPLKWGYSNALLAFACVELYKATNEFKYMEMAQEIMNFMYNYLWDGELTGGSKDYNGYVEWCLRNGTRVTPSQYAAQGLDPQPGGSYAKFIKTNMVAMLVNAEIIWANRPWYEVYMWYLIGGGIALIAIIMVVVLVLRKRAMGRSLPKVVKGLLGGED